MFKMAQQNLIYHLRLLWRGSVAGGKPVAPPRFTSSAKFH